MTSTPSLPNTSSKARVNFASRSRIRNRARASLHERLANALPCGLGQGRLGVTGSVRLRGPRVDASAVVWPSCVGRGGGSQGPDARAGLVAGGGGVVSRRADDGDAAKLRR